MSGDFSSRATRESGARAGRDRPLVTDGHGRDRQILVVGDGFASVATAAFLSQAGLDPVLASGSCERTRQTVVPFWRPGLELLERIGLRRPVERLGTRLDSLDCHTSGRTWRDGTAERPSLVAIHRGRLRELLERRVFDRIRTTERPVTAIEPTGTGVRATFEQGIEEPFDTVVTTERSLVPEYDTVSCPGRVHGWEFPWPTDTDAPERPTEAWDEDRAAFSVPVEHTSVVRLVSDSAADHTTAVSIAELRTQFGHLFESRADPFAGLEQCDLQYSQTPQAVPESMYVDGIALVGSAVYASIPGDCLGPTLAIEDAWVLADALAYGPPAVTAALEAYATRRRQRVAALTATFREESVTGRVPHDLSVPIRQLCGARTLAFGHLLDVPTAEFTENIPASL